MGNIWFTSDHHFGTPGWCTYVDEKGEKIRPFNSVEEMDEVMIERWNEVVRPGDKVYHLGDFAKPKDVSIYTRRLNGRKRLILGNHDDLFGQNLMDCFEKIMLHRLFKDEGFICSHIPMHKGSFSNVALNVHGHIHQQPAFDCHHYNVSVERTKYRPMHMDEIIFINSLKRDHEDTIDAVRTPGVG